MVSVRQAHQQELSTLQEWLTVLPLANHTQLNRFSEVNQQIEALVGGQSESGRWIRQGREMVEILLSMNMDMDTLLAALIVPLVNAGGFKARRD